MPNKGRQFPFTRYSPVAHGSAWVRSPASLPVLAEADVLDLHDLLTDLSDDLLPPPVPLHQVVTLCGEIRPLLPWTVFFIWIALQQLVDIQLD